MGKKSDWLPKDKKPCGKCGGSGSAGKDDQGRTIVCPACRGFGH